PSSVSSHRAVAHALMEKFGRPPILVVSAEVGGDFVPSEKGTVCRSASALNGAVAIDARFEQAIWFYSADQTDQERDREIDILASCTNEILVVLAAGVAALKARPFIVKRFCERGFVPDYDCNLSELTTGAIRLVRGKTSGQLISAAESAFSKLNL